LIVLFTVAAVAGAVSSVGIPAQAQSDEPRERKARTSQKAQKAEPKRVQSSSGSGLPSCEAGVLWVDSLCRRRDGKTCFVDTESLINCQ